MKTMKLGTMFGEAEVKVMSGTLVKVEMGQPDGSSMAYLDCRPYMVRANVARHAKGWLTEELSVLTITCTVPSDDSVVQRVRAELSATVTRWAADNGEALARAELASVESALHGAKLERESLAAKLCKAENLVEELTGKRRAAVAALVGGCHAVR